MNLFESVLLGAIEGATEFLPISSTGHLILAAELLGLEQTAFVKSFEIAIQSGAILAVILLFWRRFLERDTLKKLALAFVPTAILGLIFYSAIKTYLIGNAWVVVGALALGGLVLILFEQWHREAPEAPADLSAITPKQALFIGLFQSIAMIPGVSRSGATIVGGLLLGLKRTAIVEFSFLLAAPTMLAATSLDLLRSAHTFTLDEFTALVAGFLTAALVGMLAMRWLLGFVKTRTFTPFGVYRIIIAALFFWFVLSGA